MGKRYQLNRLVQWASNSIQVSRSTKRLREIDEWIDWQPLYEIGPSIGKSGPKDGKPHKPIRWMICGLFRQHLHPLSDPLYSSQKKRNKCHQQIRSQLEYPLYRSNIFSVCNWPRPKRRKETEEFKNFNSHRMDEVYQ